MNVVGARHRLALLGICEIPRQGEAVPRPYTLRCIACGGMVQTRGRARRCLAPTSCAAMRVGKLCKPAATRGGASPLHPSLHRLWGNGANPRQCEAMPRLYDRTDFAIVITKESRVCCDVLCRDDAIVSPLKHHAATTATRSHSDKKSAFVLRVVRAMRAFLCGARHAAR